MYNNTLKVIFDPLLIFAAKTGIAANAPELGCLALFIVITWQLFLKQDVGWVTSGGITEKES